MSSEVPIKEVFTRKECWFRFAEEHNKTADVGSALLNGSDSYTLAACYIAAGIAVPSSVRLDVQRTKGVADHFIGLRSYYESGVVSKRWLPSLVTQFRQFAQQKSLDPDELIKRVIDLTERGRRPSLAPRPAAPGSYPGGKEPLIPGRAEFEAAYRRVAVAGETVALRVVFEKMEATAAAAGISFRENWREMIERQIEMWMEQGESNGKN